MATHGNLPQFVAHDGSGMAPPDGAAGNADDGSIDAILSALDAMPEQLDRLVEDRPVEDLQRPSQDGGWGAVEILAHLLDWEEVTRERVRRVLDEERPDLDEYDDSLWAIEHEYSSKDPIEVLRAFGTLRRELLERLRPLDEASWQRTANLQGYGDVSLRGLLASIVQHDARHLEQVRDVLG